MNSLLTRLNLDSIRTRLVLTFIAFTILPVILTTFIASSIGGRNARLRAEDTMTAVATLKESQVKNWAEGLLLDLNDELERDADTHRLLALLRVAPSTRLFEAAYDNQLALFQRSLTSRANFEQLQLINLEGEVVLSSDENLRGQDVSRGEYFQNGLNGPYLQAVSLEPSLGRISIVAAVPVATTDGEVMGVLAGYANMDDLNSIMLERTGIGETGETYLVNHTGVLLTDTHNPEVMNAGEAQIESQGALSALEDHSSGIGVYQNYERIPVIGAYRWIPELNVVLLAEQYRSEALASQRFTSIVIAAGSLIAMIAAVIAALMLSRNMTQPLIDLTQTAEKIAGGNLDLRASTENLAEIRTLAGAFNSMTAQLRNLIGSLEERVSRRTRQLQSRSEQLLVAAEVSRSAATTLDTGELIRDVVNLIQERFGLYYVGLFLVDENREWAILRAGTGAAGAAMLRRGHRLRVDESSMVGWCIENAQPRIALEAGEDLVRQATEELPETRSEAAFPLRSRGQVFGAITIQSKQPGAFDRETLAVFQNMSDQVAVALDNARLFSESQHALDSIHQVYGELSRQSWLEKLRAQPLSLHRDASGLNPFNPQSEQLPREGDGDNNLVIPIKSRGQVIGYINAQKRNRAGMQFNDGSEAPPDQDTKLWDPGEVDLLETLTEQLGVALESARLFEDTQLRAERERIIDEVTSRMRATLDLQTILQTAIREMRDTLELTEVELRLKAGSEQSKDEAAKKDNHR